MVVVDDATKFVALDDVLVGDPTFPLDHTCGACGTTLLVGMPPRPGLVLRCHECFRLNVTRGP